jgi:hypothetical protein
MNPIKYIDIDSTYRDRRLFPNPADFQVIHNTSQSNNINEFKDPVSLGSIKYPTVFGKMLAYPISQPATNQLVVEPRIYQQYNFNFTDTLNPVQNIFNDDIVEVFNDQNPLISSSFHTVTDTVFQSNTVALETSTVFAPIDTTATVYPDVLLNFYLSDTSSDIDGYYVGKTIIINSQSRTILGYSGGNHLATVGTQLSVAPTTGDPYTIYTNATWTLITDSAITPTGTLAYPSRDVHDIGDRNLYRIRKEIPFYQGTVDTPPITLRSIPLLTTGSAIDDFYKNKWLTITNETRTIESGVIAGVTYSISPATYGEYDTALPTTVTLVSTANIDPTKLDEYTFIVASAAFNGYNLRMVIASVVNATDITVYTGLPAGIAPGDTYWVDWNNPIVGESRKILSYNGTTKIATLEQPFSSIPYYLDTFDILTINYDNFSSMSLFSSDTFLASQAICYEVTLQCLVLPNLTIKNGTGNRIAFYPYIYLEFSSASSESYRNVYITNVPNLAERLFKIPIYNVITPLSSPFVVLNGLGQRMAIKLKPRDNFNVKVFLPNGEIIQWDVTDTQPPVIPLPELQVSITLGFRRIS